jgi:hypothetical protein
VIVFLSTPLVTALDVVSLTMTLVNIESVSDQEAELADQLEAVLGDLPHLRVERAGNTVVARTHLGHPERVVVSTHLHTAPIAEGSLPARVEMGKLYGPGACDAKGCVAIMLKAAALGSYARDVTFVFAGAGDQATPTPSAEVTATLRMAPTDARFLGEGATLTYGPGDPQVAGTPTQFVPTAHLTECEHGLRTWLQG